MWRDDNPKHTARSNDHEFLVPAFNVFEAVFRRVEVGFFAERFGACFVTVDGADDFFVASSRDRSWATSDLASSSFFLVFDSLPSSFFFFIR